MNTNESTPKITVIKMSHVQKAKEEVLLQFTIALITASIQHGMEVIIGMEVVCSSGMWKLYDQWYGSPGFFDSGLQLIYIFWSLVSHFPLDNTL